MNQNQPLGSGAVAFELALDLGGMVGDVAAGDRWDMMVGWKCSHG